MDKRSSFLRFIDNRVVEFIKGNPDEVVSVAEGLRGIAGRIEGVQVKVVRDNLRGDLARLAEAHGVECLAATNEDMSFLLADFYAPYPGIHRTLDRIGFFGGPPKPFVMRCDARTRQVSLSDERYMELAKGVARLTGYEIVLHAPPVAEGAGKQT